MEICIGDKSLLSKTPMLITLEGDPYILTKDKNNFPILFSAVCPHQHNVVEELKDDVWRCPSHGWTFDPVTGKSINAPQKNLTKIPIRIENELLYAKLPVRAKKISIDIGPKIPPKITVVGSASLLIEWRGFTILTDPWLEGPAVFGSWINYPPSDIKITDLPKIDTIWISHEHTDHFNEHTLSLFDKNTFIYVPDFDDSRFAKRVRNLGFNNVISMPHNEPFSLTDEIKAISFASGSVWNDNILYLKLGNFTILNVNDAGFNWNIPKIVGKVDLVCSQFSPASGYPATWTHLTDEKKLELMEARNIGMLKMMKQIVDLCEANYLLPFANFNELYHPEHIKYVKMQPKNRPQTVVEYFKGEKVKVLDLIPGEAWDGQSNIITRRKNRDQFYNKDYLFNYLKEKYNSDKNKEFTFTRFDITHDDIKKYFEQFSGSKIAYEIGKYTISLTAKYGNRELFGIIRFNDGTVTYEPTSEQKNAEMSMICPGNIVQEIIQKDLSWDEISSGYWGIFSRNPDLYNVTLWRLLHAPWKARQKNSEQNSQSIDINTTSIADIIEKDGKQALQIFEKFGLFCAGCEASLGEKIVDGCKLHGLTDQQMSNLINELTQIKNKKSN